MPPSASTIYPLGGKKKSGVLVQGGNYKAKDIGFEMTTKNVGQDTQSNTNIGDCFIQLRTRCSQ
jgi:hypothetical protein